MPATSKATKQKKANAATKDAPANPKSKTQKSPVKTIQRAEDSDTDEEDIGVQDADANDEKMLEDESGEEEGDVNEEGMAKLMEALGEDGLDEYAQAELRALTGESEDEEEDSEEDNGSGEEGGIEGSADEEEDGEEGEAGNIEGAEEVQSDEDEDEEEEDIPLDEAESVDADAVPRQKIEIDNKIALERIRDTIKLDPSMPWTETLTVTYSETIEVDVDDDLNRELAFYKQALYGATTARSLAAKHSLPFTRPADYFAEMVKSDSHMERIRQRLLDEGASIKRSQEKRKEREGKKFGKQVQMEKLKEREKSKKDMEERLKGLKRKRKGGLDNAQEDGDGFDVAVEDAISDRPSKRSRGGSASGSKRGISRQTRDKKFGFGGPGRRSKQNTKDSTDSFESRGGRGASRGGRGGSRGGRGAARGAAKRPGKSRRMSARGHS